MVFENHFFEDVPLNIRLDEAVSRIDFGGYIGSANSDAEFFEEMIQYNEKNTYEKMKVDEKGFLKGRAAITTAGVFPYIKKDGTIEWELRHPEDVFHPDSVNSLKSLVLTNDHPSELITADNSKKLSVGFIGSDIMIDYLNGRISDSIVISDKSAVDDVQGGKRALSAGYVCDIEITPGVYNGVPYDVRQRRIRYNHAAIVDRGRAGDAVVMRVDGYQGPTDLAPGTSTVTLDSSGVLSPDNNNKGGNMPEYKIIRVDGVDCQAEAPVIVRLTKLDADLITAKSDLEKANAVISKVKTDMSTLEGERDALKAKLDAADEKLKTAINLDQLEGLFQERIKLDAAVLSAGIEGAEKMDVMAKKKAVISKVLPKVVLDGKDDAYIHSVFDAAIVSLDQNDVSLQQNLAAGSVNLDGLPSVEKTGEIKTDSGNWSQLVNASSKREVVNAVR